MCCWSGEPKKKKKTGRKFQKKTKTTPETIPNKAQVTDKRHDETALSRKDKPERDGKDYTVPTTSQANKETPCLYTSSNVVAHRIEINTTNSISKLQTKNIKN